MRVVDVPKHLPADRGPQQQPLRGAVGRVDAFDSRSGRFVVKIKGRRRVKLRAPALQLLEDQREVEVEGEGGGGGGGEESDERNGSQSTAGGRAAARKQKAKLTSSISISSSFEGDARDGARMEAAQVVKEEGSAIINPMETLDLRVAQLDNFLWR